MRPFAVTEPVVNIILDEGSIVSSYGATSTGRLIIIVTLDVWFVSADTLRTSFAW